MTSDGPSARHTGNESQTPLFARQRRKSARRAAKSPRARRAASERENTNGQHCHPDSAIVLRRIADIHIRRRILRGAVISCGRLAADDAGRGDVMHAGL